VNKLRQACLPHSAGRLRPQHNKKQIPRVGLSEVDAGQESPRGRDTVITSNKTRHTDVRMTYNNCLFECHLTKKKNQVINFQLT
jgi:hypothetical protein